jgi:hypothetical protein
VPGLQVTGAMADDIDARWVLRVPDGWNGKIVVGVPVGLRSEFMGDFIFSDFVVQEGYAYASTNKGTLNFFFTEPVTDSLACRLSPPTAATSLTFAHFYIAEPKDTITEWFRRTREVTELARVAVAAYKERAAERTYLMGNLQRRSRGAAPARGVATAILTVSSLDKSRHPKTSAAAKRSS